MKAVRVKVALPLARERGEIGRGIDLRSVKVKSGTIGGERGWCVVEVLVKKCSRCCFCEDAWSLTCIEVGGPWWSPFLPGSEEPR